MERGSVQMVTWRGAREMAQGMPRRIGGGPTPKFTNAVVVSGKSLGHEDPKGRRHLIAEASAPPTKMPRRI